MRAMPFRVASPDSVVFQDPVLRTGETVIRVGEPVPTWDYLSPVEISCSCEVDTAELLRSTGLSSLEHIAMVLQVDCPATGIRRVTTGSLERSGGLPSLGIELAPNTVAVEVEVRQGLVLSHPDPRSRDRAARRTGSRLHPGGRVARFRLEGDAAGFPVEAFDFSRAGLPADAAWRLNFRSESLDLPFLGAVRLFVNTNHEYASQLLAGTSPLLQSVLNYSILEQMLLTVVADSAEDDISLAYDSGTVGAVLNELTELHLGLALPDFAGAIRTDRQTTLARLQHETAFLRGSIR